MSQPSVIDATFIEERILLHGGKLALYQRGDVYHYQISLGKGKYERKSTKKHDKDAALKIAEARLRDVEWNDERGISNTPKLFKSVAEEYINELLDAHQQKGGKETAGTPIHITIIKNYLIAYFNTRTINSITQADIAAYHKWCLAKWKADSVAVHKEKFKNGMVRKRRGVLRKRPSASSQAHHQGLLQRIFNHAVTNGYITIVEVPIINKIKRKINSRGGFTQAQINIILDNLEKRISTTILRHQPARKMLLLWTKFMAITGCRAGTEYYNIKFQDFLFYPDDQPPHVNVVITESKIKPHTTVCKWALKEVYDELWALHTDPKPDTIIWSATPGKTYNLAFSKILKELNITKDRFGNDLTPYSLRHYAITEALGRGVPMNLLEDQYQTSAAMIKRHYGHLLHTSKSAEILKGLV